MSALVRIPQPLRNITNNLSEVQVAAQTVAEVLDRLESDYPGFRKRICDDAGEVRRFINIFVDGEDIRFLQGLQTPVKDQSELSIVPAIAGG